MKYLVIPIYRFLELIIRIFYVLILLIMMTFYCLAILVWHFNIKPLNSFLKEDFYVEDETYYNGYYVYKTPMDYILKRKIWKVKE